MLGTGMKMKWRQLPAIELCAALLLSGVVWAEQQTKDEGKGTRAKEMRWAPPDVEVPLASISGLVPCPLETVLEQAGARAVELTTNLENFTALEQIDYERLGDGGALEESDSGAFDYTFGFEQRGGGKASQEYRTPAKGSHAFAGSSQDTGQVALALIFLPSMRTDYDMSCEGVTKWEGQDAYVARFEQRKDKPGRTLKIRGEKGAQEVMLRGRAWISMDNWQVLHLETNLMHPIPAFQLRSNAIVIDYGPVQIRSKKLELWLPQNIEAYWEYEKYRIMLRHRFTNFQVFSVETQEKVRLSEKQ